jgi:hypothetical protein
MDEEERLMYEVAIMGEGVLILIEFARIDNL